MRATYLVRDGRLHLLALVVDHDILETVLAVVEELMQNILSAPLSSGLQTRRASKRTEGLSAMTCRGDH